VAVASTPTSPLDRFQGWASKTAILRLKRTVRPEVVAHGCSGVRFHDRAGAFLNGFVQQLPVERRSLAMPSAGFSYRRGPIALALMGLTIALDD